MDEDETVKNILEIAEIILYYYLNWFNYTTKDYNRIVKWKDHVQTYLNTTLTDIIIARKLFERFEETLEHMEDQLVMV